MVDRSEGLGVVIVAVVGMMLAGVGKYRTIRTQYVAVTYD